MIMPKPPSKARQERIKKLQEKHAMEKALKSEQIRKAIIQKVKDLQAKAIARRSKSKTSPAHPKTRPQVKQPKRITGVKVHSKRLPIKRPLPKLPKTKVPTRRPRIRRKKAPAKRPPIRRAPANPKMIMRRIQRMRAQRMKTQQRR